MCIWLRIPYELEPIPYTRGSTQLAMPHDHSKVEQATEERAWDHAGLWCIPRDAADRYADEVAEHGVGPFYRREQPSTAYVPPRSE